MNRFEMGMMGKVPQETTPKGEYEAPKDGASIENGMNVQIYEQFKEANVMLKVGQVRTPAETGWMQTLKRRMLEADPAFAKYVEQSERAISDKYDATVDAFIDYGRERGLDKGL